MRSSESNAVIRDEIGVCETNIIFTIIILQDLPKAEALLQTADDNADDDDEKSINANSLDAGSKKSQMGDSDTSYSDNDESADLNRGHVNVKMPLELNLSELAHGIMQNNQK